MRILMVEDEFLIATMLQELILSLAVCELNWASRVSDALKLISENDFDGAILDVNVAGEKIYTVADHLRKRDVPMVFSTGYLSEHIEPGYTTFPVLVKPYSVGALEEALDFLRQRSKVRRQPEADLP